MALIKQKIPFSLAQGINTKTDKKLLNQQGNLVVQNLTQQSTGTLSKVNGYEKIGTTIDSIFKLESYQNELLILSSYALYSYNSTTNTLLNKGELINVTSENKPVIANSYEQINASVALSSDDSLCYVWEDSRGGCYYLLKDRITGLTSVNNTQIAADLSHPSVYAIGNMFYIFCYNSVSETINCYRLTDAGLQTPSEVIDNPNTTTPIYDVIVVGSKLIVAHLDADGYLTLSYIEGTGELGSDLSGSVDPVQYTAATNIQSFCISYNGDLDLCLSWYDTTAGVKSALLYLNFTDHVAAQVLDSDVVSDKPNLTSVWNESSEQFEIFIEYAAAKSLDHKIKRALLEPSTGTGTLANGYIYSLGLASKAYRADSVTRFLGAYESAANLQNTYFLIGSNQDRLDGSGWGIDWGASWGGDGVIGIPEARILPDVAYGHPATDNLLPSVVAVSANELILVGLRQNRIIASNTESLTLSGIEQISLSLNTANIGPTSTLGQNLHIPGGFLKIYDGETVVEQNFHLYPDALSIANSATAGSVANGTYQYIAVYEWIDSKGQMHRSAPSIPVSHTVSGGPKGVDVTIPCLRVTQKQAVQIAVYRTTASGTLFYKVSSDTSPTYSVESNDSIVFLDTLADASITSRALIYTTAQLENYSPNSSNVCVSYQNRLFIADKNELFYSREHFVGEGVNFNSNLYVSVPADGGDIVSLNVLDDKLVVFKKRAIFVLNGQGPDELGRDANYVLTRVNADVGCVSAESVVLIPDGLMFKSTKGFWLLDRGLTSSYIGAPVEAYNQYDVQASQIVVDKNLVRVILDGTKTQLIYDYFHKMWTAQNFNVQAVSNGVWGVDGGYVFATEDSVYQETNTYDFDGSVIKSSVETGWLSFAGLAGFQRIYRVGIVGNLVGGHKLVVKCYYDYSDDYSESFSVDANLGADWGSDVLWGDSVVWGGGLGNYLYEIKPSRQKCTSIKIRVEDAYPESVASEGLNLNALVFTVGVKEGSDTSQTAVTAN